MEDRYVEWVRTPRGRKGTMIKKSLVEKIIKAKYSSGYTSVYSFNKEDAMEIRDSRRSAGFDRFEVGASRIAIDLDDGETQLEQTEKILKREGLGYEVWFSGSKGFHLFISTDFMCNIFLPYSHLQYLLSIGVDCDESLYQHGRILSLPGRVHPKTRLVKKFVKYVEGEKAIVPIVEKPKYVFKGGEDNMDMGLADSLIQLTDLGLNEPKLGNRHTALWCISKDLIHGGLADATVYDLLTSITREWDNSKTEDELISIVTQARRQA